MSLRYNDVALCKYDNFMSKRSTTVLKKERSKLTIVMRNRCTTIFVVQLYLRYN